MKIFITSDTHRDLRHVIEMYDAVTSSNQLEGIPHVDKFDCMIHCGDFREDAFELGKIFGLETYCVFGNCDGYWDPDFDIVDTPAGSIVLTHGHVEDINTTHQHLYELADDQGCNCICYGHSHIPVFGEENGYTVINPGSPTKPLDGTEGSCAILTADENGYSGEIVYYADVKKAIKAKTSAATESAADSAAEPSEKADTDASSDKEHAESQNPEPAAPAPETAPKKKSGVGGFLRRIFNYSDGQ